MRAAPSLPRALPLLYAVAAIRLSMPFLVFPVMAARLGMAEFGRLGLALVWAGLLALVVEWGFQHAATRQAVPDDAVRRLARARQIFTARCVLSVPVGLLGFGIGWWLIPVPDATPSERGVTALLLASLACAQGWPATWYIQGTMQVHRWARVEFVVYLMLPCACLAFAHRVETFLLLMGLSGTALAVLGWRLVWNQLVRPSRCAEALQAPAESSRSKARLWCWPELRPGLTMGWTMLPATLASAGFTLALPAIAASQMARSELGLYFLADRIVRALLAAADPVIQLVYPRIVARFAVSERVALAYAARWAVGGLCVGLLIFGAGLLAWPLIAPRLTGVDAAGLAQVLSVFGLLVPLAMGWRFLAYWMLGSGHYDTGYRASIYAGALAGIAGAWLFGQSAAALSAVVLAAELAIMTTSGLGVLLARRRRRR